ncbi:Siroheme synthase [Lacunisphaera limnophila]|uniref:uroporphyrinogen-III C-methyltransferase n=1 Tax=Lacunisphaera limnophila TaxID=1838286 RepID=A0A1D8ATD1_9BACT|nr:uroporphyrinogen-III C-methyltransferase [Lacunisphaera limnophila]AOS44165.1 Siroheme synthase [Lacunisphaera limnophila]
MLTTQDAAKKGFVWLVGAGPGAADLITLRGLKLLQGAEAVVYDELANGDLLQNCPAGCELHAVGKRAGKHSATQGEINALLVSLGSAGKKVVRLKGGDPLVFGRAGEEIEALRAAGLSFEIVPGVTAATASAAALGLPLTHRDFSSAVVFVTGHQCAANTDALDWGALARLRATLCFYMGVRRLPEIAHNLLHHGMAAAMPLALISEATRSTQKITITTLGEAERMAPEEIVQPALVVIGEVVRLADFADRVPGMVAKAAG